MIALLAALEHRWRLLLTEASVAVPNGATVPVALLIQRRVLLFSFSCWRLFAIIVIFETARDREPRENIREEDKSREDRRLLLLQQQVRPFLEHRSCIQWNFNLIVFRSQSVFKSARPGEPTKVASSDAATGVRLAAPSAFALVRALRAVSKCHCFLL